MHVHIYRPIGLVGRAFANGPGDWCLIPCRVVPKTQKVLLDTFLFNAQHYKVSIKGKKEKSKDNGLSYPLV